MAFDLIYSAKRWKQWLNVRLFSVECNSFKPSLVYRHVPFSTLDDKDIFVSMPTGSGKSLIYQFPAALQERQFAIVFSPLLALIQVRKSNVSNIQDYI